jgi:hypothetical protein
MKIRQARKTFRRATFGQKANKYFSRIKRATYTKALNRGITLVIRAELKQQKEAGE